LKNQWNPPNIKLEGWDNENSIEKRGRLESTRLSFIFTVQCRQLRGWSPGSGRGREKVRNDDARGLEKKGLDKGSAYMLFSGWKMGGP